MTTGEVNAAIYAILKDDEYIKKWQLDRGYWFQHAPAPPFCSDRDLAGQFRDHVRKQEWFFTLEIYDEGKDGVRCSIIPWGTNDPIRGPMCETEAEASSRVCLAAWQAMAGGE